MKAELAHLYYGDINFPDVHMDKLYYTKLTLKALKINILYSLFHNLGHSAFHRIYKIQSKSNSKILL